MTDLRCVCGMPILPCKVGYTHAPEGWMGPCDNPRPPAERCSTCERCTWNPGPDCGEIDHPHCPRCSHCQGRHESNEPEEASS